VSDYCLILNQNEQLLSYMMYNIMAIAENKLHLYERDPGSSMS